MVKMNRMDRDPPFLSNKTKQINLHVDIPDGCQYSDGMPEQVQGSVGTERMEGARSGMGKKTSVV